MLRHRHRVLPRLNFSSPYVDLPNRLKVGENLMVFAQLYGIRDARARIGELAADLDLEALLGQKTGSLSSGPEDPRRRREGLLNQPEMLLLDEPTASLDPDTADWVRTYLERYQRATGASILLASHNMAEVERLCQDVLMMKAGKIVDRGAPAALITRYGRDTLEEVFLDIARNRASRRGGRAMTARRWHAIAGPLRRIGAILLRHYYLARSSSTRLFDLMYWPLLQMVVWGFITVFLARHSSWVVQAGGVLIGGVLLWDVLVRGQFGMTLSLLEEMWSRNLANLFVSPLAAGRVRGGADGAVDAALADRRHPGGAAGDPDVRLFDLRSGPAADRVLGGADHVRLGRRPDDLRGADPLRPGGGKLRLGVDLRAGAGQRRLLPDRHAAAAGCGSSRGRCRRRTCSKACAR